MLISLHRKVLAQSIHYLFFARAHDPCHHEIKSWHEIIWLEVVVLQNGVYLFLEYSSFNFFKNWDTNVLLSRVFVFTRCVSSRFARSKDWMQRGKGSGLIIFMSNVDTDLGWFVTLAGHSYFLAWSPTQWVWRQLKNIKVETCNSFCWFLFLDWMSLTYLMYKKRGKC